MMSWGTYIAGGPGQETAKRRPNALQARTSSQTVRLSEAPTDAPTPARRKNAPRAQFGPHTVVRQHVLPIPLEVVQRIKVAGGTHDTARDKPGVVPGPVLVPGARGKLVLRMHSEPSDVSGDLGASLDHAKSAFALLGAMEVYVRIESRDDFGVHGRGLCERVSMHYIPPAICACAEVHPGRTT